MLSDFAGNDNLVRIVQPFQGYGFTHGTVLRNQGVSASLIANAESVIFAAKCSRSCKLRRKSCRLRGSASQVDAWGPGRTARLSSPPLC